MTALKMNTPPKTPLKHPNNYHTTRVNIMLIRMGECRSNGRLTINNKHSTRRVFCSQVFSWATLKAEHQRKGTTNRWESNQMTEYNMNEWEESLSTLPRTPRQPQQAAQQLGSSDIPMWCLYPPLVLLLVPLVSRTLRVMRMCSMVSVAQLLLMKSTKATLHFLSRHLSDSKLPKVRKFSQRRELSNYATRNHNNHRITPSHHHHHHRHPPSYY